MRASEVVIIDGGGANITSLMNALSRLGARGVLTRDPELVASAGHAILPGVGRARPAMQRLAESGLADAILARRNPTLGICLGMQLLATASREDDTNCLGVFPETADLLMASTENPVPNMGWCETSPCAASPLMDGITGPAWFYFVHSFALPVSQSCIATSSHAGPFAAAVQRNNFYAVQFHPERSAATGAKLLENFLELAA